jgi:hypothetical protein
LARWSQYVTTQKVKIGAKEDTARALPYAINIGYVNWKQNLPLFDKPFLVDDYTWWNMYALHEHLGL